MTFREISQTLYSANLGTKIPRDDAANLQIYGRQEIDNGGTQTTESEKRCLITRRVNEKFILASIRKKKKIHLILELVLSHKNIRKKLWIFPYFIRGFR